MPPLPAQHRHPDDPETDMRALMRATAARTFAPTIGPLAHPAPGFRADDAASRPSLDKVLALNAALIRRNHELETTLSRQQGIAPPLHGGLPVSTRGAAPSAIAGLTPRQVQVLRLVLTGHPSKAIAADLGISRRTVENHRAAIMCRSGATSLPALARMAVGWSQAGDCR